MSTIFDDVNWSVNIQAGLVGVATFLFTKWLMTDKPKKRLPPGPKQYLLFGNALSFWRNDYSHLEIDYWAQKYGDAYTISMGNYDILVVSSKEAIRQLFVDQGEVTSYRPILFMHSLMDATKGLLNNMGSSWKAQRKVAITALRDFGVGKMTLEERILEEVDSITAEIEAAGDEPVDLNVYVFSASINTICSIIFGERYNYEDREFQYLMGELRFIFSQGGIKNITLFFPQLIFLMPLALPFIFLAIRRMTKLQNVFHRKIQGHRSTFDPENIRDFVDLYLEAEKAGDSKGDHSESQLFQTIFDLFVAGSETTATTLRWAMVYLVRNTEKQDKCRKEIFNVVGESRKVTYKDHTKMPYIQATIEESLRLGSIAPHTLLHTVSQATEFRNYHLPAGMMILGNMYTVHRDPANFEDPEEFRPERWLDKDGQFHRNPAFMGFSVGPRECPGKSLAYQEIFLILTTLLQRFRFTAVDPENPPSTEGRLGITRCPDPFKIRASKI